jgi:hypothetical protein
VTERRARYVVWVLVGTEDMNERNRDKNRITIRIRECWYSEGKETEREAVAEPRRAVYMRG